MDDQFSSPNSNSKPMITVQNAYKSYGKKNAILKGLCMTVEPGTIYGLLGPSGCGKTTLLCCITGQLELDQGSVLLNIKRRKQLGYMPQMIGLFGQLSIMENLLAFGYSLGLSKDEIENQFKNSLSFLELPSADNIVRDLSGGQQRRVSMAVTFLHDPTLLIMDEPTVGLDPILCQNIWEKLLEFADQGKSIVITTHYIQEAQRAHKVGLMRNGRLLVEESPQILMDKFGCTNLEDVFYQAIMEQEQNPAQTNRSDMQNVVDRVHNIRSVKAHFDDDDKIISKKRIKSVLYKRLTVLRREFHVFAYFSVFPILLVTIYNVAVGEKPRDSPIAIINEEIPLDNCHLDYLKGICLFDNTAEEKYFSCLFVDELRNNLKVLEYSNVNDAMDALHGNKVRGILRLPSNYTTSLGKFVARGTRKTNDIDAIIRGFPDFWTDNSNYILSNFMKYDVLRALVQFLRQVALNCNLNPEAILSAVKIEKPVRGDVEIKHSSYITEAMMILASFTFPTISLAVLFVSEKSGGQVERYLVSGVTPFEIVIAESCIQLSSAVWYATMMLVVTFVMFDNPLEGSALTIFFLLFMTSVCGVMFGFVTVVITDDIIAVANVGTSSSFILSVTSGLFATRESMHDALKLISEILPLTWIVEAVRCISNKGATFTDKMVLKGFYTTAAWILIFFLVVFYHAKYKKNSFVSRS